VEGVQYCAENKVQKNINNSSYIISDDNTVETEDRYHIDLILGMITPQFIQFRYRYRKLGSFGFIQFIQSFHSFQSFGFIHSKSDSVKGLCVLQDTAEYSLRCTNTIPLRVSRTDICRNHIWTQYYSHSQSA